ncbi:MAG: glycerol-3-phosphate acyltransferase [Dehalococcoidales bacterium]|nr:glycerol-3-phosphate acyltransferase [Dehalococcoidales bacterium]
MGNILVWVMLVVLAYLVGSIPFAYLAARARGIDLRWNGTQQIGGGNLWRTVSKKLGIAVGAWDFFKGMLMVLIAWRVGLDAGQQLTVGLAAIVGHNWPVFLRFHGGRGVATSLGIIIVLPILNKDVTPWTTVAFFTAVVVVIIFTRRTPVPILVGTLLLPVFSAILHDPLSVTLGFTAMALILIIKRLTAQPPIEKPNVRMGRILLNRFLYDRDIADRKAWVYRRHHAHRRGEERHRKKADEHAPPQGN